MITTFFLLFSFITSSLSNYTLIGAYSSDQHYGSDAELHNIYYKFAGDSVCIVERTKTGKILVKTININTSKTESVDTINAVTPDFFITDIVINKFDIVIIGYDYYYSYQKGNIDQTLTFFGNPEGRYVYKHGSIINDSLVLLYKLYDFHPNDGEAGLHLNILNLKSNKIIETAFRPFPSIILSHINSNWVTTVDGKIITVSPLTGVMSVYNSNLNLINIDTLSLPDINLMGLNQEQELRYDSIFNAEKALFHNAQESGGRVKYQSNLYSKDGIWSIIKEVRSKRNFIEKIFPISNDKIGISIARPELGEEYRDLYVYNVKKNNVISTYKRWRVSPSISDTLQVKEDFFVINLKEDCTKYPYFYDDSTAYVLSFYNPKIFYPTTKDSLAPKIYADIVSNGYNPQILKYKY